MKKKENRVQSGLLQQITEKLLPRLPDWVTGKTEILDEKLYLCYGHRNNEERIKQIKLHNLQHYLLVSGLISLLFLIVGINWLTGDNQNQLLKRGNETYVERPEITERSRQIALHVEMEHQQSKVEKDLNLKVNSREMSAQEKEKILKRYADLLTSLILGENASLDHVTKPLKLLQRIDTNGITIQWNSQYPQIINDTGDVDWLGIEGKKNVVLTAELSLDDLRLVKTMEVAVERGEENELRLNLEKRLNGLIEHLEKDRKGDLLLLPTKASDDVQLKWSLKKNYGAVWLIPGFLVLMALMYQSRYQRLDREWAEIRGAVLKDFPGLVNKLVLLLNAGLVVTSALAKIADDYTIYKTERRVLYDELVEMQRKVRDTNLSIISELKTFAQRCGIREFMRFSAILAENVDKGAILADKLELESELLWNGRKKYAEEKGRMAETKLTLPLLILLIALIAITIAPAMMEM